MGGSCWPQIAATILLVAPLLAYDIARRSSSPATQVAGPIPSAGSTAPDRSANPLSLSMSEQPENLLARAHFLPPVFSNGNVGGG